LLEIYFRWQAHFLLAGPLFAGKSFLMEKPILPGRPQFAEFDFQTVRTQFADADPVCGCANQSDERTICSPSE
jgi:hypothetical protein